jgi:Ca2+:H+ antiporter
MAKLTYVLTRHLRKHPLSLRFKSSGSTLMPSSSSFNKRTVILLCTYQAIGLQYYKYTYDGINIIFINLLPVAFFVIFDENVLHERFPNAWFTSASFVFMLGLGSVIPLSYFIGMAVSSISAQSSMGLGAVINATFGSIIEIILYSVALMRGKSSLVEGSLIGSFLAGVLLMPGCSMLSGAVKRKEQKFNAKSAGMYRVGAGGWVNVIYLMPFLYFFALGVTSTMLIMAIIAALTPTLFYQMYGSVSIKFLFYLLLLYKGILNVLTRICTKQFELRCSGCPESPQSDVFACSRCYYDQMNPAMDPVYQNSVKPLMWLCACVLPTVSEMKTCLPDMPRLLNSWLTNLLYRHTLLLLSSVYIHTLTWCGPALMHTMATKSPVTASFFPHISSLSLFISTTINLKPTYAMAKSTRLVVGYLSASMW